MCGAQWTTQTEILLTTGKLKAEGKLRSHERTLRDKRDTRRSAVARRTQRNRRWREHHQRHKIGIRQCMLETL